MRFIKFYTFPGFLFLFIFNFFLAKVIIVLLAPHRCSRAEPVQSGLMCEYVKVEAQGVSSLLLIIEVFFISGVLMVHKLK